MTLGSQISQLRRQQKMSQEELAAVMCVSRQAISKWETGQCNPDTENLIRLAEVFGVDVAQLIREEPTETVGRETQRPAPVAAVWILSVLLALAVAAAVTFFCLWQSQLRESTVQTETDIQPLYENFHMYTGLHQEISLTAQEQNDLVKYIIRFKYTEGEAFDGKDEDGNTLYGGRHYTIEYTLDETEYYWSFTEQGFLCRITIPDWDTIERYYAVDYVLLYELDRYE